MFEKIKSLFSSSSDVYENEIMYHKNGKVMYEGTVKGSNFHGLGKYYAETGELRYEGNFVNGLPDGKGKCFLEDGSTYEGDLHKGERTGMGIKHFPNGDVYEGRFVNGQMEGKGKLTKADGTVYEGNFLKDHHKAVLLY